MIFKNTQWSNPAGIQIWPCCKRRFLQRKNNVVKGLIRAANNGPSINHVRIKWNFFENNKHFKQYKVTYYYKNRPRHIACVVSEVTTKGRFVAVLSRDTMGGPSGTISANPPAFLLAEVTWENEPVVCRLKNIGFAQKVLVVFLYFGK